MQTKSVGDLSLSTPVVQLRQKHSRSDTKLTISITSPVLTKHEFIQHVCLARKKSDAYFCMGNAACELTTQDLHTMMMVWV